MRRERLHRLRALVRESLHDSRSQVLDQLHAAVDALLPVRGMLRSSDQRDAGSSTEIMRLVDDVRRSLQEALTLARRVD